MRIEINEPLVMDKLKKLKCPECGHDVTAKIYNFLRAEAITGELITINGHLEMELMLYDDSICIKFGHAFSVYAKMIIEIGEQYEN
jgi:hypothetical protein